MPLGYLIKTMNTVFETRRIRLRMLVEKYGTVVQLNRELGWANTNARLYQIHNRSIRSDRGTPYEMGDPTAREVEILLKLPVGWMDTPPTYAELAGGDDPRVKVALAMERMPDSEIYQLQRFVDAVAQPAKDGTNSH